MGIFSKIFKDGSTTPQSTNQTDIPTPSVNKISLNTEKENSMIQLNLKKDLVANMCTVGELKGLNGIVAKVVVAMDYSGSMRTLYKNGTVQNILNRLLPLAMNFDDDGAMEVWLFENGCNKIADMTLDNHYGYIENERIMKKYDMGGTNYAPVMKDIYKTFKGEQCPVLVLFITDGDNFDKSETTKFIRQISGEPIFWQFVGIGNASFDYLEKLDDLDGRVKDNANFFPVNNINRISDEELYSNLLKEYAGWIKTI